MRPPLIPTKEEKLLCITTGPLLLPDNNKTALSSIVMTQKFKISSSPEI